MTAGAQIARYAVVGHPVSHSLSPRIHARFAQQTGEKLSYEALDLDPGKFETEVRELERRGYAGLNVTVPFKRDAWALCDRLSPRAEDAGAVNTLSLLADGIVGDNTDGAGLVRDLADNLGVEIEGRDVLLLGAGGAARGVLAPLLARAPASLSIANRTPARAVDLARDFGARGNLRAVSFEDLQDAAFDLVINATSAGLDGDLPPLPASAIGNHGFCYDMMYNLSAPTAFVAWARANGAGAARDGLGMLVEQAAESFFVWRGVRPETADVLKMLRPE